MKIKTFSYTKDEVEDLSDLVKVSILRALVREGVMKQNDADIWAKTHSVVFKEKRWFSFLTENEDETKTDKFYIHVVKMAD